MKKEEKKAREAEETRLNEQLARVRFFPGSQAEYEAHVGYQVRVIDTGRKNMGVKFGATDEKDYECFGDFNLKKHLVEQGIEAIVNCNYSLGGNNFVSYHRMYGLPVAKK